MRWKGRLRSENVEDRRAVSGRGMAIGGAGGLLLFLVVLVMSGDPMKALQLLQPNAPPGQQQPVQGPLPDDEVAEFVSVVLRDTENVWGELFGQTGRDYREPKLVLFRGSVSSACGFQSAAVGPFYCPADETVYIDLSFFEDLKSRYGAPGDFAQAYVIAHEVGHHVQKLLGISAKVNSARARASQEQANDLSVRVELQADFFAGVWAHHAERNWQILEEGDIEEALNAAAAIGDDRLQKESQGFVVPESFTHGSSEQRARWFTKGLKTGAIDAGDTFAAERL
ncbi:MAG: zinc metallopeptidase [Pirellulales bacterium]|jgi:predicted metalloprotease|nr:zinc metallopeptidase [Thermoguttaceae bacterium]MDD4788201.1 zinc metallopeptidase [Pirellulales bacterium]MDI9445749.1 neutral zinc metallopeptidase [Planctomycetota bacterium]NLZ01717.1 flagellar biosynthesis protein FlgM [Pirellulaceae bacterium]